MDLKEAVKTILAALGFGGVEGAPPTGDNDPSQADQPVVSDEDVTALLPEMIALVEGVEDPEKAAKMKAALDRLKPAGASDEDPDEENTAADEGETDNKAEEMLPDDGEQKTAMDRKPKRKSPGGKPPAFDEVKVREQARVETVRHFKALSAAAQSMRPVLGVVDAFAYDSAADIYGAALKQNGVDLKKYPRESWRGMAEMLVAGSAGALAQDAALPAGEETHPAFSGMMAIGVK